MTTGPAPECEVLLATFNGERYLPELLDSVLSQSKVSVSLRVIDDGSSDGTVEALRRYATAHSQIQVFVPTLKAGVPRVYFDLITSSRQDVRYAAFCDQDDVWFPDKLARAITTLEACDPVVPSMYFSALTYTDTQLSPLKQSRPPNTVSFRNALTENVVHGCTAVINAAAREVLRAHTPRQAIMHDWWCYLVVAGLGHVHYDPLPSLFYRQHESNAVGGPRGRVAGLLRTWGGISNWTATGYVNQIAEFLDLYGKSLSAADHAAAREFVRGARSAKDRLAYGLTAPVARQTRWDELRFRLRMIAGLA